VDNRGTTVLFVAKPASHTWASKEQAARKSMLPRSWCVDYTPREAWSLVGKYLEGMEEDAPLISFLSESKADIVRWMTQSISEMKT
jgi:hypothetical protein